MTCIPCKPQFYCIKVRFEGSKLHRCVSLMFAFSAYTLAYVTGMKPPLTPPVAPEDRVYSVAVNAPTSRPIKANVYNSTNHHITDGDFSNVLLYQIETLDVNAVSNPAYVDAWVNSGGYLSMWGRKAPVPGRLQRKFFT